MPVLRPATSGARTPTIPPTAVLAQDAASVAGGGPASETAAAVTLRAGESGIPARLLLAYREAADILAAELPGCHLSWELLAAIGKIESGHAAGRPIGPDGTISRPILGPPLDGSAGVALIRDTDGGKLDHDMTYDRAVGPMQFIPTTWAGAGRDGNGDGKRDPHNIHDATLAAGFYLCAHNRDLAEPAQLRAAIYAYNPSDAYVRTILAWMRGYQNAAVPAAGTETATDPPSVSAVADPDAHADADAHADPESEPVAVPTSGPDVAAAPAAPGSGPVPVVSPDPDRDDQPAPTITVDGTDLVVVPLTPRSSAASQPTSPAPPQPARTEEPTPAVPPTAEPTSAAAVPAAPTATPHPAESAFGTAAENSGGGGE
ncbi:Transglycosylase SLT domain-containing protein [Frankia sp. EI5c]|uniref:lytic transglycosylase domain-containing protein n=1 Tax=Frankia sp. EI5c TaxID=683316 RepID=UPI0007C400CD|nr:lytic transglycosylase domain-containing protein [Frankia sp. EI5c]OAA18114.1 Transglycosylase SLT domain-containing protein [Frankia sp. EI5c]